MFNAWCSKVPPIVWMFRKIFPEDFNPHYDLDLEESNQILPQNSLAVDDAPLYPCLAAKDSADIEERSFF